MAPLLRVAGLQTQYLSFGGARVVKAVDGIDFTVNEGETIGLVGKSGCGKTTTCLSVVGLLPPAARIVAGSIEFAGEELTTKPAREMRRIRGRQIAMILQDPMASLEPALQHLLAGRRARLFPSRDPRWSHCGGGSASCCRRCAFHRLRCACANIRIR